MKQKLGLCCALIHEPEILLLDEPTFGVDPISRRDLWLILHEMVADGITVVVATAYLDEAERCDRVALLHEGHLIALDAPAVFQQRLAGHIYTVRTNAPRRASHLLRGHEAVRHAVLFGDVVHVTLDDPAAEWPHARSVLTDAGIAILEEGVADPTLEDAFIDLVAGGGQHAA
jgi:ABC-2 type transport system ATP-binding protein